MSATRQFLRSSGIMVVLYAGSTGLSFLSGILLARMLGADGYGAYALALTTATLVGMVTEFGLPTLVLREASAARANGQWSQVRGLMNWSNRAVLVLSFMLIAGTWAGHALFAADRGSEYLATLIWSVLLIPFVAFGKLRSNVLLALDHVAGSQLPVMILRPVLFLVACATLFLLTDHLAPAGAMAAQVFGAASAMVVIIGLYRKNRPEALIEAKPARTVRSWLATALPMGLTEGLRLLQGQLGLLLVGAFAGTFQAGLYRVADAVAMVTAVFVSVAGTAATPMFGRLWRAGDHEGLQRVALLCAIAMTAGTLLLGLPLAIAGDRLIPFIFGRQFTGSAEVFLILWLGSLVSCSLGQALSLANMTGRHVLATQSFVVIAVVNSAIGAVLIPGGGAVGAALATSAGSIAGTLYCTIRLGREERINPTLYTLRTFRLLREPLSWANSFAQRWSKGPLGHSEQ